MFRKVRENSSLLMLLVIILMGLALLALAVFGSLDLEVALGIILLPLMIYGLITLVIMLRNR